jgi:hypothetical protein
MIGIEKGDGDLVRFFIFVSEFVLSRISIWYCFLIMG